MKICSALTAVILSLLVTAGPASAAVVEYTSFAAFSASTTNLLSYNFNGIAPAGSFTNPSSLPVGPASFSPYPSNFLFVIDTNAGFGSYGVPYLSSQQGNPVGLNISISPTTAIGFFYGSYLSASDPLSVSLSTGDTFIVDLPSTTSTTSFIGFTSSSPITSVQFLDNSSTAGSIDLTSFAVLGVASAVPELATWLMILLGFAALGFIAHRRNSRLGLMAA
jgi:hypothetical protein